MTAKKWYKLTLTCIIQASDMKDATEELQAQAESFGANVEIKTELGEAP